MKKFKIDQFVVYKGQLMKVFNRNRFFNVYTLETFDGHLIFSVSADDLEKMEAVK